MSYNMCCTFSEMDKYKNDTIDQLNSSAPPEHEFYEFLRHPVYMITIYSMAYTTIMLFAIVGNIMVVAVVVRNKSMHTVTNYFIMNLAIADIMVALICLPMTLLTNLYTGWNFGWFMCKATPYLQGVSVCASVNTLAAIAVDRFLAICCLMKVKITKKACKLIIVCIWITSFTLMIPWAIFYQITPFSSQYQEFPMCVEQWPYESAQKYYFLCAIFIGCYSAPLVLIVACYFFIGIKVWRRRAPGEKASSSDVVHKSKIKAVKMLAIVVALFAFSWLPLYVIKLASLHGKITGKETEKIVMDIINPIAQWLGSSNSSMNPLIYCFFSKRYRRGFKDAITRCCRNSENRRHGGLMGCSVASKLYMNGNSNKNKSVYLYRRESSNSLSDLKTTCV